MLWPTKDGPTSLGPPRYCRSADWDSVTPVRRDWYRTGRINQFEWVYKRNAGYKLNLESRLETKQLICRPFCSKNTSLRSLRKVVLNTQTSLSYDWLILLPNDHLNPNAYCWYFWIHRCWIDNVCISASSDQNMEKQKSRRCFFCDADALH